MTGIIAAGILGIVVPLAVIKAVSDSSKKLKKRSKKHEFLVGSKKKKKFTF